MLLRFILPPTPAPTSRCAPRPPSQPPFGQDEAIFAYTGKLYTKEAWEVKHPKPTDKVCSNRGAW